VLAIRGAVSGDVDRLVSDLSKVLEEHHNLFGTPDDLDRYVFLLNAPVSGYGGLEHRWSSANICSRDSIPVHGDKSMSDGYRQLLGLLSHEYFHLWNIKRIKQGFNAVNRGQLFHHRGPAFMLEIVIGRIGKR